MSVFFTSRKTGFKSFLDTSPIPCCLLSFFNFFLSQSWQLLNIWWIDRECFCLLDSFSTHVGSIEILIWYLIMCSSTPPRYLYLSTTIFSTPSLTDVSTPLDTSRHLHLLIFTATLFKLPVRFGTNFARSLSRYFSDFSPKLSHLTPIIVPQGFFKLFQVFLHLVSF